MSATAPLRVMTTDQSAPTGKSLPKLTVTAINRLLPGQVASEIKGEKLRSLFLLWVGVGSLATEMFYIACFLVQHFAPDVYVFDQRVVVPSPVLMGMLAGLSLIALWSGGVNLRQIIKEASFYLQRRRAGEEIMPQFIITNYKRLLQHTIVLNWLLFPTYLLTGVTLGLMVWLNFYQGRNFQIGFWQIGLVPDLSAVITAVAITMGVLVAVHALNWGVCKWRKSNIISYFGADIIVNTQVKDIAKRTNRICFWSLMLFLVVVFAVIAVPVLIVKRRRQTSRFKWPWKI